MEELIIFILSTAGLTHIVTKSKLFIPIRESVTGLRQKYTNFITKYIDNVLNCPECFGLYSGFISYMAVFNTVEMSMIAYGFSGVMISIFSTKILK